MRTAAEEQLKAVFTHFVGDSIHSMEDLRAHLEQLGLPVGNWNHMRQRDKHRLAKRAGLVSLKEAIQMFERPTYFKEVIAGLTSLFETDGKYQDYLGALEELDTLCANYNMTWTEVQEKFPTQWKIFSDSRSKWFARQAYVETWAFTKCPGHIGTQKLPETPQASGFATADQVRHVGSFNSMLMVDRPRQMDRIIRRHLPSLYTPERCMELMGNWLFDWDGDTVSQPLEDPIFIRQNRIVNLCTLETPLR